MEKSKYVFRQSRAKKIERVFFENLGNVMENSKILDNVHDSRDNF